MTETPYGYAGNALIVDLTDQHAEVIPLMRFCSDYGIDLRAYLGGDGIITKILLKDFAEPIDPLSSENELIIAAGPWTATAAPQAGRAMLGCISPETGGFSSGSFGWLFPSILKFAGFDILLVRGKARRPTFVFVDDKTIQFRSATHLWGKETWETVRRIREELGERYEGEIRVLSTSISGEHLVRYSAPCADGTSCPGRSGGGAVMGSKNLKAIAVRGSGAVSIYNPRGLLETSHEAVQGFLAEEPLIKLWQEHGASTCLSTTANWPLQGRILGENRRSADFPHLKNVGCLNCMNPCYHWLQIKEGRYNGLRQLGGHMTFLTNCLRNLGIRDFGAWIYYERLLQELGLDSASFSMAFSFAVDCYEMGLLNRSDTDGLELKRGDEDLIWEVARRVAYREGSLGELLSENMEEMARRIGKEAEELAPHVKAKPSIQRDSKLQALMWSFGSLTSPRGGDWLRLHNVWELAFLPESRDTYGHYIGKSCLEMYEKAVKLLDMPYEMKTKIFGDPPKVDVDWVKSTKGKALFSVWTENLVSLFNSLVTCMFGSATQFLMVGFGPSTYAEIINQITGWDTTDGELMKIGERVFNLQRLFNYRLKGWDYRNDRFADKRAYEPATTGIYKRREVPWDSFLQEYYRVRGWSKKGLPTKRKLRQLGLEEWEVVLENTGVSEEGIGQ